VKNGLKQLCPTMLDPRSLMCLQGERAAGSVIWPIWLQLLTEF